MKAKCKTQRGEIVVENATSAECLRDLVNALAQGGAKNDMVPYDLDLIKSAGWSRSEDEDGETVWTNGPASISDEEAEELNYRLAKEQFGSWEAYIMNYFGIAYEILD